MCIQWLIDRQLDALERRLGVKGGVDDLRQMSRSSRALFFRFVKAAQLAGFHRQLSPDVFYVASLTATQREGCGDCLQMGLNAARGEGMAEELLEQLSLGREAKLPGRLAEVQRYTPAVLDGVDDAEARESLRICRGDAGLMEPAMPIASARLFPVTKRALGMSGGCALPPAHARTRMAPSEG